MRSKRRESPVTRRQREPVLRQSTVPSEARPPDGLLGGVQEVAVRTVLVGPGQGSILARNERPITLDSESSSQTSYPYTGTCYNPVSSPTVPNR